MLDLKILLQNLSMKRQIYVVRYYAMHGPKKSYKKGLFQRMTKTQM